LIAEVALANPSHLRREPFREFFNDFAVGRQKQLLRDADAGRS
jgi:hypothetical protein